VVHSEEPIVVIRIEGNVTTFNETLFAEQLASTLGIDPSRIIINRFYEGSVVIEWTVTPTENETSADVVNNFFEILSNQPQQFEEQGLVVYSAAVVEEPTSTSGSTTGPGFSDPVVTVLLTSETISNRLPFIITFTTYTTQYFILQNPRVVSLPYSGSYSVEAVSTQLQGDVYIQSWKFLYSPNGTCVLNGDYKFEFDVFPPGVTMNTTVVTLSLQSQDFCGTLVDTEVYGTVDLYCNRSGSASPYTCTTNQDLYFSINIETGWVVSSLGIVSLTFDGVLLPSSFTNTIYLDPQTQGTKLTGHFNLSSSFFPPLNTVHPLVFTVSLQYANPSVNKRGISIDSRPSKIAIAADLAIKEKPSEHSEHSSSGSVPSSSIHSAWASALIGASVAFLVVFGAICVAVYMAKRRAKQRRYETEEVDLPTIVE